jgi:indolepyruvate decarboxylase
MSPPHGNGTGTGAANGANGRAAAAALATTNRTPTTPTTTTPNGTTTTNPTPPATTTVAKYVVDRLAALGIRHCFGVPGDYVFPVLNEAEKHDSLSIRISPNELQAAYAADGYARATGKAACLITTYGVGELSAINGVMGARAHRLPLIHVVGGPSSRLYERRLVTHHSLGDGAFLRFANISAQACVAHATLTPQNCAEEVERCLRDALRYSGPAYLLLPNDFSLMPVVDPMASLIAQLDLSFEATRARACASVPAELDAAVADVLSRLKAARKAVILPTVLASRYGADDACRRFLKATGLRYATTPMDKACAASLGENAADGFVGVYAGASSHPLPQCRTEVETADFVLDLASSNGDLNRGFWSAKLDARRVAVVSGGSVRCGAGGSAADGGAGHVYSGVGMRDFMERLADAAENGELARCPAVLAAREATQRGVLEAAEGRPQQQQQPQHDAPLALRRGPSGGPRVPADDFYPRLEAWLKPSDTLVAESGSCMLRLPKLTLPQGARYESQSLWASIGWATGAAHGLSAAAEAAETGGGRVVVVTGDGAFQMTATELGAIGRYGAGGGGGSAAHGRSHGGVSSSSSSSSASNHPRCADVVFFVLNNSEYGIEATIGEPGHPYDDLAAWRYSDLPEALGCPRSQWFTARVSDADALDASLREIDRRRKVADALSTTPGASEARFSVVEVLTPPQECWRPLPEQALRAMYAAPTPKPPSAQDLRAVGSGVDVGVQAEENMSRATDKGEEDGDASGGGGI